MSVNQAVVFTKPLHHLGIHLSPEALDERVQSYFNEKGFKIVLKREVSGPELAAREVIKQHYLIYSSAVYADPLELTAEGKDRFAAAFGKQWDEEVAAGRVLSTAKLLTEKKMNADGLFVYWNALFTNKQTAKVQDGVIMGYIEELDAYCVNAFYPAMEANFYAPSTRITYYVMEFDSEQTSWLDFRKKVLGSTNAAAADSESFRGRLYAEFPVEYPGRDNFVHGSAGPFEGFVERLVHEPGMDMTANPIGRYLAKDGVTIDSFAAWKNKQSIERIGDLFDATEEQDTEAVLPILAATDWD